MLYWGFQRDKEDSIYKFNESNFKIPQLRRQPNTLYLHQIMLALTTKLNVYNIILMNILFVLRNTNIHKLHSVDGLHNPQNTLLP